MMIRVSGVPRSVCGDSDWHFDNLIVKTSVNLSKCLIVEMSVSQFSKRQSMSQQTVLLGTTLSWTITLYQLMIWLFGFKPFTLFVFPSFWPVQCRIHNYNDKINIITFVLVLPSWEKPLTMLGEMVWKLALKKWKAAKTAPCNFP